MALLAAVTLGLLLPFIHKAFHIDDPLFLWTARHVQVRPMDFYGFPVNWYGREMPMAEVMKNPPLTAYCLAGAAMFVGWGETGLHLAFLVPALAVVFGTYLLAKELCSRPVLAALLAALTPVFLLSCTSVMCDTMMLAFWVWAVLLWREGTKEHSVAKSLAAAVLMSLCALTKYFGISLIPLLAVYAMRFPGARWRRWLGPLLLPVLVLGAYQWYTGRLYSHGLLTDAAGYAQWERVQKGPGFYAELLVGVTFVGGCLAPLLFFTPFLWSQRALTIGALVALALLVPAVLAGHIGRFQLETDDGFKLDTILQQIVFIFGGLCALALAITDWRDHRDADSLLLVLWYLGTFTFAGAVNWTVNGRSILPMAPAMGILLVRRLGLGKGWLPAPTKRGILWLVLPAMALGLTATWSDYALAGAAREAAREICEKFGRPGQQLWFQGHWGFQYYMELHGAKPLDFYKTIAHEGDRIATPFVASNLHDLDPVGTRLAARNYSASWLLATLDKALGAGYHSSVVGPLPFAVVGRQWETYGMYELPKEVRFPVDTSSSAAQR
jgi:4-amino-4-deoxy-L-arabinose transferase-like glycosyltransferase